MSLDSWSPKKPCFPTTNWGLSMVSVFQLQVVQLAKIVDSSWPPMPPRCPLVTLCDPHSDLLVTNPHSWPPDDSPVTSWWLLSDFWVTSRWLPSDFSVTSWWLPHDFPVTFRGFPGDIPVISWWLPSDFLVTFRWLPGDFPMTSRWLPGDFTVTSRWLPSDFPVTSPTVEAHHPYLASF